MGLLDWLLRRDRGETQEAPTFGTGEGEFAGLNMKQVLDAHMAWRTRLEAVLTGNSKERLEVSQISPDNLCVLGKWLYGPGQKIYGTTPEYEALRSTHKTFHLTAGKILSDYNSGNKASAAKLLTRDFRKLSDRIQLELVRLYASKK